MTAVRRIRQALRALDAAIQRGEVTPSPEEDAAIAVLRVGTERRIRRSSLALSARELTGIAGKNAALEFNARWPVGTPVLAWPWVWQGQGTPTRTRSRAWCLGDGTPVVAVDGKAGGIALTHVEPIKEQHP